MKEQRRLEMMDFRTWSHLHSSQIKALVHGDQNAKPLHGRNLGEGDGSCY